ncbi:YcjF family protein [Fluviibacterium sp. S390]|uniref:YcjF family protein n=1 Tax=Fluviibacterium sp. S390 TaxID=3415139 RepID=UPI003C7AC719
MSDRDGPVMIDLEAEDAAPSPSSAPPVPDLDGTLPNDPAAMQRLASMAKQSRRGALSTWFWALLGGIMVSGLSLAAWSMVERLIASSPVLAGLVAALLGAFGLVCLLIALREVAAFARLGRLDKFQHRATAALADNDLEAARKTARDLTAFYHGRAELKWALDGMPARIEQSFDADAVLGVVERDLLRPLDTEATRAVESAARQVATVTALVPLALADVVAAATANLRMIRTIAEIYGGRAGTFGTWRLMRAVLTHLVATGAVAVGDDLIGSVAGGSVLSRVSRRFGEGVVNGALTARVGVAAIEVCRPLPFTAAKRPSVARLVKRALTGLFGSDTQPS